MNVEMMHEVLRITDRFMDRKDPDAIDRQGRLTNVIVVVVIFHAIMGLAFIKMQEYEMTHPRIIRDVDVQFELAAPPPEPTFKVGEVPKPISLTEGENPNPGSAAAPKPLESERVTIPTPKAPETQPLPTPERATPVVSRQVTIAPPVAVVKTNIIKAAPLQKPKTAPVPLPPSPVAGAPSTTQKSGAPSEGGAPDGAEGGTGTGGEGSGGTGVGQGDPGAGSGMGTAGGEIATKVVQPTARPMGNIAPYRKDMLVRIAQNWNPKRKYENIVLLVELGKDGTLLRCEVLESSGNKKADKEAIRAIEATQFAHLPDWYKGESLPFKIELSKVEALRQ